MSNVAAYTALHYGREYLAHAIRSVIADVNEYIVLYSPQGSHSVRTDVPCPETRAELYAIAQREAGDKLKWIDGAWSRENEQRESIYQYTDAEIILVLDADEVWHPGLARHILGLTPYIKERFIRVPFYHYWRSLKRVIKHDPAFPQRVILRNNPAGDTTFQIPPWLNQDFCIHHFGYAQSCEIVGYKMKIHGHIAELRPRWFEDAFLTNAQNDTHPVGSEWWNPEACEVPYFMADHEYAECEVIP